MSYNIIIITILKYLQQKVEIQMLNVRDDVYAE